MDSLFIVVFPLPVEAVCHFDILHCSGSTYLQARSTLGCLFLIFLVPGDEHSAVQWLCAYF